MRYSEQAKATMLHEVKRLLHTGTGDRLTDREGRLRERFIRHLDGAVVTMLIRDERDRQLVTWRYHERWPVSEIARWLQMSERSVRERLDDALRQVVAELPLGMARELLGTRFVGGGGSGEWRFTVPCERCGCHAAYRDANRESDRAEGEWVCLACGCRMPYRALERES